MALTPGTRLGVYEITAHIAEGGMGQVFRATDTKLKRQVAIKILPPSLADDADRLARFQREAEVLASLNHPNIAAIYGLEESGGITALVMELVEGDDLSQRIAKGAIPLDEALPGAKQIAEALEAAHEQGIIHRDLKPANIKVRSDGTVKVLDFGLAKTTTVASLPSPNPSQAPTITSPGLTQRGMILGTVAYMSPEQARGRAVDKRADIWAFGAVLFEMITGTRAFRGDNVSDTLVSVVTKEPDWDALPPASPASLRQLLTHCLIKEPRARLRDIGDARLQIEDLLNGVRNEMANRVPVGPPSRPTVLRFTPLSFEDGGQTGAVWSPDGKAVAFGARRQDADPFQVHVRYLNSSVSTPITELAESTFPVVWTSNGQVIFRSAEAPAGLWSVSPVGGEPEPLQTLDESWFCAVSLDGMAAALLRRADDGLHSLWISSPPGAAPILYEPAPFASRSVFDRPTLEFSPDGARILLIRDAGAGPEAWLMPWPMDARTPPHRIFQGLSMDRSRPEFSWMPNSRHVVLSTAFDDAPPQLLLADTVSGAFAAISSGTTAKRSPPVCPDGRRMAFLEVITDYDIVSVDLATAAVTPVIATHRSEQMPAWAAKAAALVYVTDRNGPAEIWLHRPGEPDRPVVTPRDFPPDATKMFVSPSLSPDASRVIYTRFERDGPLNGRLWISAVAGGTPARLVKSASGPADFAGSWSPDGKWFVYFSRSHDGRLSLTKVKTTGRAEPETLKEDVRHAGRVLLWSPSGDWILYSERGGMSLISPDGATTREISGSALAYYAFSLDGQRLYGIRSVLAANQVELFSKGIDGGTETTIGTLGLEYRPASGPTALRLSLTPDGKSITYSILKLSSNLWLMDGLDTVPLPS